MTVAELFIKLGVSGDGSAKKALKDVDGTLGNIRTSALAAKAGLLAVVYGVYQLASGAGQTGLALKQFGDYTGLSVERLQQWQYAAVKAGSTGEEMAGSLKGVQSAMTNMLMGKGAPEGMGVFARAVGFDMKKANDTFYVMDKLRQYARTAPTAAGNKILSSFGISEGTIMTLRTFNGEVEKLPYRTERQVRAQAQMQISLNALEADFKRTADGIALAFGPQLIASLNGAFKFVRFGIEEFEKLNKKIPEVGTAIKVIGAAIALYFAPVTATVAGLVLLFAELQKYREGKDNAFTDLSNWWDKKSKDLNLGGGAPGMDAKKNASESALMGNPFSAPGGSGPVTNSISITNNIHGAGDPQSVADKIHKQNQKSLTNTYHKGTALTQNN